MIDKNRIKYHSVYSSLKGVFLFFKGSYYYNLHKLYLRSDETDKFAHIMEAINYVRVSQLPTVYFEFGVHSARTFSNAITSSRYLNVKFDFFAFDSFAGLPETISEDDGFFEGGEFKTSVDDFKWIVKKTAGYCMKDDHIIEGFYDSSLTKKLSNNLPKVGVVHIDVDLYSSTIEVLNFIKPHLVNGTVILFDDWYCFPPGKNMGEKKALDEFLNVNKDIKVELWKSYSTFGKSFIVTEVMN